MGKSALSEIIINYQTNKRKLAELRWELTNLRRLKGELEKKTEKVMNDVLANNSFYASKDGGSRSPEVHKGDRITDCTDDWLLNDEDYKSCDDICSEKLFEAGLVDKNQNPLPDYYKPIEKAENKVIEFFILKVVPKRFQKCMWDNRKRYDVRKRIIKMVDEALTIE